MVLDYCTGGKAFVFGGVNTLFIEGAKAFVGGAKVFC